MDMLTKIDFENIESYEGKHLIELHDGLNFIFGETDSGKSAIQRMVDAVINRKDFTITYWKESGKITLIFDDLTISRTRIEKMKNVKCKECKHKFEGMVQECPECGTMADRMLVDDFYELNGERTKNTGSEIPEEILIALNMSPISIDDKGSKVSLNIFPKDEKTSFVDMKPQHRIHVIGAIGKDLILVEEKNTRNNKELKRLKSELKDCQQTQRIISNKIEDLDFLDEIKESVERLEKLIDEQEQIKLQNEKVDNILTSLKLVHRNLDPLKDYPIKSIDILDINGVRVILNEIFSTDRRLKKIISFKSKSKLDDRVLDKVQRLLLETEAIKIMVNNIADYELIDKFNECDSMEIETILKQIKNINPDLISGYKSLKPLNVDEFSKMKTITDQIQLKINSIKQLNEKEIMDKQVLEKLNTELQEIDMCPLCGTENNDHHLFELVS
jgi:hypothetical protein